MARSSRAHAHLSFPFHGVQPSLESPALGGGALGPIVHLPEIFEVDEKLFHNFGSILDRIVSGRSFEMGSEDLRAATVPVTPGRQDLVFGQKWSEVVGRAARYAQPELKLLNLLQVWGRAEIKLVPSVALHHRKGMIPSVFLCQN